MDILKKLYFSKTSSDLKDHNLRKWFKIGQNWGSKIRIRKIRLQKMAWVKWSIPFVSYTMSFLIQINKWTFKIVQKATKNRCKCIGISSSCTYQVCWSTPKGNKFDINVILLETLHTPFVCSELGWQCLGGCGIYYYYLLVFFVWKKMSALFKLLNNPNSSQLGAK